MFNVDNNITIIDDFLISVSSWHLINSDNTK